MEKKKQGLFQNWGFIILLCLSLGLAPFVPEPHIVGKLRWIAGGGEGMQAMDYFDLLMHGFPWLLLIFQSVRALLKKVGG